MPISVAATLNINPLPRGKERRRRARSVGRTGQGLGIAAALGMALLCGCSKKETAAPTAATRAEQICKSEAGRRTIGAYDGGHLFAMYHSAGKENAPAVVLQHMIPPHNDHRNFPPKFIQALVDAGLNVLNVDRRGAGKSQGRPKDAYVGPLGADDVEAAVDFLGYQECKVDTTRVALVGASNGSTSIWDYAQKAVASRAGAGGATQHPPPLARALVFLSGGKYTENQHDFATHGKHLAKTPILFLYPESEAEWNLARKADAAPAWQFAQLGEKAHGTKLLVEQPESTKQIVQFVKAALK